MEEKHLVKDKENGCPVGHRCGDCNWYRPLYVPNKDGEMIAEWDCRIASTAVLLGDVLKSLERLHQGVNSSRNESIKRQDEGLRRQDDFFDILAKGLFSHVDVRLAQIVDKSAPPPTLQAPNRDPL